MLGEHGAVGVGREALEQELDVGLARPGAEVLQGLQRHVGREPEHFQEGLNLVHRVDLAAAPAGLGAAVEETDGRFGGVELALQRAGDPRLLRPPRLLTPPRPLAEEPPEEVADAAHARHFVGAYG